jgi:hypothetical protein
MLNDYEEVKMLRKTTRVIFSTMILLLIFTCAQAGPVPDTGQTTSYTNTFGEDSDYLITPPSYTKLDASGNDLVDTAASWIMVRDNVTGLIWEVKTNDGSVHDKDNTYTWYDSNPETNGGNAGTSGNGTDTEDFINALNSSNYGGYSDWRLPTAEELIYIVDYGTTDPGINDSYFPNTMSSYYWSSTSVNNNSVYKWFINFGNGASDLSQTSNKFSVRAVRGGQSGALNNLISNGDGTVTDKASGLMWQQETGGEMNWGSALSYCENSSLAGYSDWRLPTIKELVSIVDWSKDNPAIETEYFPNTMSSYYWSSTSRHSTRALYVYFIGSYVGYLAKYKTGSCYVRAVRGGYGLAVISDGPVSLTNQTGATFTVGGLGVTHYRYKLDDGNYSLETAVGTGIALTGLGNGAHTLSVLGRNSSGAWQTSATVFSWTVDTLAPEAVITGAPTSITNAVSATLTINGTGVTHYKYKLDEGAYSEEISVSVQINLSGLTQGGHTLYVIGKDAAGNWQATDSAATATWTVDTTKPVVTGLTNDAISAQSKIWSWDATDASTVTFRYLIDQNETWAEPSGAYSDTNTAAKSGANGVWYIHVQAKDAAGNESDVVTVSAIIDNTAPAATISGMPASPTNQSGATLTVGGDGVTHYKYKLDDADVYGSETAVGTGITLASLSDGSHTVHVLGRDAAGNWQSTDTPTTATWTVDTTKPVVTGLTNDTVPAQSKTWAWDATDAGAVTFRYLIDQNETWAEPSGDYSDTKTAAKSGADGIWYIHVQTKDAAGNESDVVTVSAIIDNTAPAATISGMPASSTNQSGATLTVGGDGVTHYKYKLDDADVYGSETAVGTGITLASLSDGSHTVHVLGRDAAGNWQSTDTPTTATWTVDTTKPVVTGLTNDTVPAQSKTWNWDATDAGTVTFRYLIDQNETWPEPSGDYSDTKTAAKSGADGIWYIHVQTKDAAGNESDVVTVSAVLDNTAPIVDTSPVGGLFNVSQNITLSVNETADIYYTIDGSTPTTNSTKYASAINVAETTTLKFLTVDKYGNQSEVYTETYTIDIDAPASGSIIISDNQGYTNQAKPTLQLSSEGAAHMRFALSEEALSAASWLVFAETWNNFDISAGGEGAKTVWAEFKDLAGNIQTVHVSDSTIYDTTVPVTQVDKIGGIYEESVTVQLSTEEGAAIYYTIDGSIPATTSSKYSTPISITGDTTLKFFAIDKAGNAESVHTETYIIPVLSEIKIDSDSKLIDKYKGTIQFSATGVYENIDDKNITTQVEWISSNNETATIDEAALLTGIKAGFNSVEISAKAGQIVSNKILVTLNIPVTLESIEISPDYLVLTAPGVTAEVTAIGYYSNETTEDITGPAAWASNDTSIVTVSTSGVVTAKGYGSTTLSAMKDGITSQIEITVGDLDQTEIEDIIKNRGNLILVTGGGTDDALWPVSNALSDYVYKVFISRGFTDDDIYFLNPETDHDYNSDGISDDIVDDSNPTPEAIQEAIGTWAKQADTQGPLYLVLVDHGANQKFLVNNQGSSGILAATNLNQWLNDFQTATNRQVVVIIEACQSGSFVGALKHTNRAILASTQTGTNSNLNNKFSFGKFFLSSIFKGTDLKNAYDIAGNKLKYLPAPWKNQVPQFDDMQDGSLAQSIFVGGNFKIASAGPVISGEVTTSVANDGKVTINATVTDLEGLQEVWAIALPPDFTPQYDVVDFNTPDLTGLPTFDMTKEQGMDVYSVSTYSIAKAGDHKVIVYAMDTEGNTVNSEQKIVTITGVNPTCQISLAEGWNLISLCREPSDSSINVVLADIKENVASVWKWVAGNWAVCLPGLEDEGASYASSKGFGLLTEIVCGEGFWVNSSINQSVIVSGTQPSYTFSSLTEGWNLIGLKSDQAKTIADLISGNETNIASVWKWDNGKWAVYLPGQEDGGAFYADNKGFTVLSTIEPGEGFWVNCTEDITLD